MKWFKHLTASGSDPDIGELMDEIGFEGYYLFFRTIEIMSTEFNIDNPGQNLFNFGWFLSQFSRKITKKKLINFLEITSKNKRIFYSMNGKFIHLNCPKLKNLTDEYTRQKPYRGDKEVTGKVTEKVIEKNETIVTKVTPKIKDLRSYKNIYPQKFEDFWKNYPRKIEKKDCFITWRQFKKIEQDQVIIASKNYASAMESEGRDMKHMKHPKSFLNKDRWKEYVKSSDPEDEDKELLRKHKKSLEARRY